MKSIQPWHELRRTTVFKKYSFQLDEVRFRFPDGHEDDYVLRQQGPVVCIVGLTNKQQIITIQQFRPGPQQVLYELPGGYVDPGEDPAAAAQREFKEETGYEGDFQHVVTAIADGYSNRLRHCYVATNCHVTAKIQNTPNEHTIVKLMSLPKFRDHLRSGQLTDIEVGYLCLDFLGLL